MTCSFEMVGQLCACWREKIPNLPEKRPAAFSPLGLYRHSEVSKVTQPGIWKRVSILVLQKRGNITLTRILRLVYVVLLLEEILHPLIGTLSRYLQGFVHPRWSMIFSINNIFRGNQRVIVPEMSNDTDQQYAPPMLWHDLSQTSSWEILGKQLCQHHNMIIGAACEFCVFLPRAMFTSKSSNLSHDM